MTCPKTDASQCNVYGRIINLIAYALMPFEPSFPAMYCVMSILGIVVAFLSSAVNYFAYILVDYCLLDVY